MSKKYILTLSCEDKTGIVAAVSGFLSQNGGFIIESAQFGDSSTGRFFMRTVFSIDQKSSKSISDKFSKVAKNFNMDWHLYDTDYKPKVLIMVSKYGHCLNDLLHRYKSGDINIEIPAVVSNHKDHKEMADWYNIPFFYLPVESDNKKSQEEKVWQLIQEMKVDLTVLARYMQVVSPYLVSKIYGNAINIHHSFLPGFKGAKPYHQAFDRGVKIIGATAHYVSDDLDEGPIIEQEIIRVNHSHNPSDLLMMGRDIECAVLARAVKYHTQRRVILNGNKTVVF